MSVPNEITIDGVKFIRADNLPVPPVMGKAVIVRTDRAGVHIGFLDGEISGQTVKLRQAQRIWRWRGANTLNELALYGTDDTSFTRISEPVPEITLLDAIEVLSCTETAQAKLMVARWAK